MKELCSGAKYDIGGLTVSKHHHEIMEEPEWNPRLSFRCILRHSQATSTRPTN